MIVIVSIVLGLILLAICTTPSRPDVVVAHGEIILPMDWTYSPLGEAGRYHAPEPFQIYLNSNKKTGNSQNQIHKIVTTDLI
jgi:hypothetical protein